MKPKIITICGSSRFCDIMAVCGWLLEREEGVIVMGLHLLPNWYPDVSDHHLAEKEGVADQMDELHLRKIDLSDEVFVVNYEDYIGDSTKREIAYAKRQIIHHSAVKRIRWYTHDPIGHMVDLMITDIKDPE